MRNLAIVYLKGFCMGAADTVPGVSGGTIALITGIYERLITAVTNVDPRDVRHLLRPHDAEARSSLRDAVEAVDLPFLLPLGFGIVTAVVVLSRLLHTAVTNEPATTYGFFFGLIAASAFVLYREVDLTAPRHVAVAVVGVVLAVFLTGATSSGAPHVLPLVFFAGALAISAMVLPGVSGAFLLVVLGQYEYMTGTLTAFVDAIVGLLDGGELAATVAPGIVVVTFITGALVGLLSIAHAVKWALESHRAATLTFLVSLMVGSLRLPVVKVLDATGQSTGVGPAVAAGVVGVFLVVLLDYYTDDLDYT